jgi:hypothetical protein
MGRRIGLHTVRPFENEPGPRTYTRRSGRRDRAATRGDAHAGRAALSVTGADRTGGGRTVTDSIRRRQDDCKPPLLDSGHSCVSREMTGIGGERLLLPLGAGLRPTAFYPVISGLWRGHSCLLRSGTPRLSRRPRAR